MSFNDNVQLDTGQVSGGGGGGGRGGMVIGGGLGGIILLIVAIIFGINPSDLPGTGTDTANSQVESGGTVDNSAIAECKTGADANRSDTCRIVGTVNSVQAYWGDELKRYGKDYTPAKTVIYQGSEQSACGTASNQVGPFYCPLDQKVYIDASFSPSSSAPMPVPWRRSTSWPTSTATTSRTSWACSTAPSRTRRAPRAAASGPS